MVAIWGFGFNDGNHLASPQQAQTVINWFKSQGVTVMGGVPTYWRTLTERFVHQRRVDPRLSFVRCHQSVGGGQVWQQRGRRQLYGERHHTGSRRMQIERS